MLFSDEINASLKSASDYLKRPLMIEQEKNYKFDSKILKE